MNHIELLTRHGACPEGIAFAEGFPDLPSTIAACNRPDWLRWALRLLPARARVQHACYIVRNTPTATGTVWDLLRDPRSRTAIEMAERWLGGEATDEDLRAAISDAAIAIAYGASAIAYAAYTAYAAYAATATSAAYAAYAAAYDASAAYAARAWQIAYIKSIDWSVVE